MSTDAVLQEVNERHGWQWRLTGRLGGNQSGAYLLADPGGGSAVLKWTSDRAWAPTVLAAAPLVARLRTRGWPTPRWLACGTTSDGYPYQVQELAAGTTQERVTVAWLDVVLPQVRAHAGLADPAMRDWAGYDVEVLAGRDGCRDDVAGSGPAGADLVARIEEVCAPLAGRVWPAEDLVHGDLSPRNVLVAPGGVVTFVDVEALGRGSRVHDLANLLLYAALWGEPDAVARLEAEGRAAAVEGQLVVTLAAVTLPLLQFGTRHWPGEEVDRACRKARTLLNRVEGSG